MKKPKVLAYVACHYGVSYLAYAIESIYNSVDEILILYTPKPSHGSGTSLVCPDSEDELIAVAASVDPDNKVKWIKGHDWNMENQQRNYAHSYGKSNGFDILVLLDFDEVWVPGVLDELIEEVYRRRSSKCLIWMRHLWRSFNYVCDDGMRQERIYYLGEGATDLIYASQPYNHVYHFGYCIKSDLIRYKISIHGHSSEWLMSKQDWFEKRFMQWPPEGYLHPACHSTWVAQNFDKTLLPEIMRKHPFYLLDKVP